MDFIIEVGTAEQQELIRKELQLFNAAYDMDADNGIRKVIVPADFDSTVNSLLNTSSYQSVRHLDARDVVAQAKVIYTTDGTCVVVSPHIFSAQHDTQTRCFIYMHELFHVANQVGRSLEERLSEADVIYMHNLEVFVDEYVADRLAYHVVDKVFLSKSGYWQANILSQAAQFLSALTDPSHLGSIKSRIRDLQAHQDIVRFLSELHPTLDGIFRILSHSYSLADSYPEQLSTNDLAKSRFVNGRTMALVDYARKKFNERNYDFSDGLSVIRDCMRNFGIAFSDSPQGLVCHVDYSDF